MKMPGMNDEWEDFSERLRWRFPKLTESDVVYSPGREEDTLQRIQDRLGKTRAELLGLVERMRTVV